MSLTNSECKLDIVFNDEKWATTVSPDQESINSWLEANLIFIKDKNILHIGIGNSSIFSKFKDIALNIDGITVMNVEANIAKDISIIHKKRYQIYVFNKYDISNYKELPAYDLIIDNNAKKYSCCQKHWVEYFRVILSHLKKEGVFITHEQGFAPNSDKIDSLSIKELKELAEPGCSVAIEHQVKNEFGLSPVVIKRK